MCGRNTTKFTTHMAPQAEVDHYKGQVVETNDGFFVSARLPDVEMLRKDLLDELMGLIKGWDRRSDHLPRGDVHAAATPKFFGGGLKGDQDARIAMPHSLVLESHGVQLAALETQKQLRQFLKKHVISAVEKYFFSLVDYPKDLFASFSTANSFIDYFTSITCGRLFFNRTHTDDDLWMTVLVAVGDCARGGGFAHPTCGVVHAIRAGHILVVNPAMPHCTSEFGDAHATRHMIAIFVSVNAWRACATSAVVAKAHGLPTFQKQRKRKR